MFHPKGMEPCLPTLRVNIENFNKKIRAAEKRGFKVFVIWDEDPNPEKTIESILKKEKC